jgi:hypothetical protein
MNKRSIREHVIVISWMQIALSVIELSWKGNTIAEFDARNFAWSSVV